MVLVNPVPATPPQTESKLAAEEIPEGENLSGGFRAWFNRRARQEAQKDAGVL